MTSVTTTARARARAEITEEIKAAARRQVAESGAASLSLRAVARELGMVSSALYRYFPSRDALLTALIIDAFDAVGAVTEEAVHGSRTTLARWRSLAEAVRGWAHAHPHDYALIYGTPVPGYQAPRDTVDPAARVSLVMLQMVAAGVASGEIDSRPSMSMPRAVHLDLARLRELGTLDIPDEVLARGLQIWMGLFGAISYELFGHLNNVIDDLDVLFDHHVARAGAILVGREP